MKKIFILFLFLLSGCSTPRIVPIEYNIKIKDSCSITTNINNIDFKIREYCQIKDTLVLQDSVSKAIAYVDTANNMLKGELTSKIVYRDIYKEIYKDSVVIKDRPVEVVKEVTKVPTIYKISLWVCIGLILAVIAGIILKLK